MSIAAQKTKFEITDFEQFAETFIPWDLDHRQLDRGPFSASITQIKFENGTASHNRINRCLEVAGQSPVGAATFVVAVRPQAEMYSGGQPITSETISVIGENEEIIANTKAPRDGLNVVIPLAHLDELAQLGDIAGHEKNLRYGGVFDLSAPEIEKLRFKLRALFTAWPRNGQQDAEASNAERLDLAAIICLQAISNRPSQDLTTATSRGKAVDTVIDYLDSTDGLMISIVDLCRQTDVGLRALEYGFKERYGLSPKAYLKARQLSEFRRRLVTGDRRKHRIGAIAKDIGFRHLSQLSTDYFRHFGELPSDTLRNQ